MSSLSDSLLQRAKASVSAGRPRVAPKLTAKRRGSRNIEKTNTGKVVRGVEHTERTEEGFVEGDNIIKLSQEFNKSIITSTDELTNELQESSPQKSTDVTVTSSLSLSQDIRPSQPPDRDTIQLTSDKEETFHSIEKTQTLYSQHPSSAIQAAPATPATQASPETKSGVDQQNNLDLDQSKTQVENVEKDVRDDDIDQISDDNTTASFQEEDEVDIEFYLEKRTKKSGIPSRKRKRLNEEIDVDSLQGTKEAPLEIHSDDEISAPRTIRNIVLESWKGKHMSTEAAHKLKQMRKRRADVMSQRKNGEAFTYFKDWVYDAMDSEQAENAGEHESNIGDIVNNEDDELDPNQLNEFQNDEIEEEDEFEDIQPSTNQNNFSPNVESRIVDTDLDNLFSSAVMDIDNAPDIFNPNNLIQNLGDQENYDEYTRTEESFGDRMYINQLTFSRRPPTARWKKEEVALLHESIRMFGTDFSLISRFFPTRTRREIKNKFSSEEKRVPNLINELLNNKKPIDIERFIQASKNKDAALGIMRTPYVEGDDSLDNFNEEMPMADEWDRVDETEPEGSKTANQNTEDDEWDELEPDNLAVPDEVDEQIDSGDAEFRSVNF